MRYLSASIFLFFYLFVFSLFGQTNTVNNKITSHYFGFDFWGIDQTLWKDVYGQMEKDSYPFDLVGTDAVNWHRIEPEPPSKKNGHSYNWEILDAFIIQTQAAGKVVELGIRPMSNWGTTLTVDNTKGGICCGMSPLKSTTQSDIKNWGMTAEQAWFDFVFNMVERYDGDGVNDAPMIVSPIIKTVMLGNEVEAKSHYYENGGTIENYQTMLKITYKAVKAANSNVLVVRGKSNPGYFLDDEPSEAEMRNRRADYLDSLIKDISYGAKYYDVFAINYNDHYTSLSILTNWLKKEMKKTGVSKPFLVADARTTAFPRDNYYKKTKQLLPPIYPKGFYQIIENPKSKHYETAKKLLQADEAMQSIKKIMQALITEQIQISLQPVYSKTPLSSTLQNHRKQMWLYSGFFDPYIYEKTGNIEKAREPLYWAMKELAEVLIGANKKIKKLNIGKNVYAYQLNNDVLNNPIIIWHENNSATDQTTGLRLRKQNKQVDLSKYIGAKQVLIQYFTTAVNSNGTAIKKNRKEAPARAIIINEMPVCIYPIK